MKTPRKGDTVTVRWGSRTGTCPICHGKRQECECSSMTGIVIGREGDRYVIRGRDGRTYVGDLAENP